MRDSKDVGGLVLRFPPEEWRAFLDGARNGEGDRFAARERDANACRGTSRWQSTTFDGIRVCMFLHSLPQRHSTIIVVGVSVRPGLLSVGFNNELAVAQIDAIRAHDRLEFK
jgi:hypothetical protein